MKKGQLLANPKSLPRQGGQLRKFPWSVSCVSTAVAIAVQSSQVFKTFRNCSESSRHNLFILWVTTTHK